MARKDGNFLRGALGPYVYRVVRGKQVVSMRPVRGKMKQTPKTKKSNQAFGLATMIGRYLRESVINGINGYSDDEMNNRLTTLLVQSLAESRDPQTGSYAFLEDSFSTLEGFEFNRNSKLSNQMASEPAVAINNGILTVTIPQNQIDFTFKFPRNTFVCRIVVYVSLFRPEDWFTTKNVESQTVMITRNKPVMEEQKFTFAIPDGCLCLVSTFLQYANYGPEDMVFINNQKFNPGQICAAFITPGVFQDDERLWIKMEKIFRPEK
ncbi:hypothetical protein [Pedobacter sp. L105]|uniref:hypothetical protein n=1 Tax=Pedobacter sp. L105 TaxID=1641871 RepID=UPI00131AE90A|nr:hypothetical protein [Pedobacter sp. L105]